MAARTRWTAGVVVLAAMVAAVWAQPAAGAQAGKSPVKVFILAGQSNMEGQGVVDLDHDKNYNGGKGNLEYVMRHSPKAHLYKHLRDKDGKWVVRGDVWISFKTGKAGLKTGGLSIGYTGYGGKHHIGPELQFGHVIGEALDNQVLLIKTAWGGKSLYKDFRPPSSGGKVGPYYTKMLAEIREALADIKKHFGDYDGKGYEIVGFVWMQGWNDMCTPPAIPEYEQNLANLIKDVRKELKSPNLPVVIGELGNGGPNAKGKMAAFRKAQAAVAQRPEFKGTVKFVKTAEFARPAKESPNVGHGHHWFGNAESYFLIGDGLGKAMVEVIAGSPVAISWKKPPSTLAFSFGEESSVNFTGAPDITYTKAPGTVLKELEFAVSTEAVVDMGTGVKKPVTWRCDPAKRIPVPGKSGVIKGKDWASSVALALVFNPPSGKGKLRIAFFKPPVKGKPHHPPADRVSNWLVIPVSFARRK